ncbi:CHAT domain-containing protein [Nostoc sp. FACHB-110]|uniref:CHAT domain-containing protein n=1 Tax=Nostoc sp. FACHB-110 TaxID=2692834 RepID=UPI0016877C8E|nr:CHAT domain-containing protein [Nostoc sp. FACHB-110]MBD2441185.1 CHAT domain-containing protein [Nostoc sp. FACHB-110]
MTKKIWFRYLLIGFLTFVIALNSPLVLLAGIAKNKPKQEQAQLLLKTGRVQLNQAQPAEALKTWQEATKLYRQLNNQEGITESLVYQNYALQQLGLHFQACKKLIGALKLNDSLCEASILPTSETDLEKLQKIIQLTPLTPANFLALQSLGEVLRLNYKLSESEAILRHILISSSKFPEVSKNVILSLGNTQRDIYKQVKEQYQWIDEPLFQDTLINFIPQKAQSALLNYQAVINNSNTPINLKFKAQLNCLGLLIDFQEWLKSQPRFQNIQTKISQQIEPLISEIFQESSVFEISPPEQSIQDRLKLASSLSKLPSQQMRLQAISYVQNAWQMAKNIHSSKLEAKSLQMLGDLEPEKSLNYFETALTLAQSVRAEDITYSLQAKLGNLYQKQGKIEAARQAYGAAVNSVTSIRANLLSSNSDSQFFFYEKVDPIYKKYMSLIAKSATPDYNLITQIHEQLHIAELEDYLKCGKLDLLPLDEIQNLDDNLIIIHLIDLNDSIEVISKSPKQPLYHHSVKSQLIRDPINNLVKTLQDKNLAYTSQDVILSYSQILYKYLIAPIKYLPKSGTIVFTVDASFQSLPMGLLHDGNNYLLKRYGIAGTLGSRVQQPKLLKQNELRAFIAGISKVGPSFFANNAPKGLKALPGVEVEIANVQQGINSSKVLLNEEFLSPALDKELTTDNFPIVHLTTHAQFSSIANQTMIFAWDKPITISEFNNLLKEKTQFTKEGIELLVLSACQTAKGNKRSALGMAGVAVQAGARSTIATLWQVDADSSALLMKEFYQRLKDGSTKVEALRQAQLQLLSKPEYQHPAHWAAFVLIGGWL